MSKSIRTLLVVVFITLLIAFFWDKVPLISQTVHAILDPTAGALMNWNVNFGMILFTALISLFVTLIQKYTTDQATLREIKKEQKLIQEQMKKADKSSPEYMNLAKKSMELFPKTFDITMRPLMYTSLPIILFFRWFNDYFASTEIKIFGFLGWIWAYLLFSIIFSTIFRKVFNVA